jgi:hypothetical protein
MAIPQDGLSSDDVQKVEAYEATATLVKDPAVAKYIDVPALKLSMAELLGEIVDHAVTELASDHAKLQAFLEAAKAEAGSNNMSEVQAKIESHEAKAGGSGGSSGASSASGSGSGSAPSPSPAPHEDSEEHHDSEEDEDGEEDEDNE